MNEQWDIFISHSYSDTRGQREREARFVNELRRLGHRVWHEKSTVQIGSELDPKVGAAIKATRCFVLMVTREALLSSWVNRERALASWYQIKFPERLVVHCLNDAPLMDHEIMLNITRSLSLSITEERNIVYEARKLNELLRRKDFAG